MHQSHLYFTKFLWVAYLAVAVVFIQSVQLHAHIYSGDPATSDHTHKQKVHIHYDVSDQEHPDDVGQIGLSQQGLLKKLALGSLLIVLFAAMIIRVPHHPHPRLSWRLNRCIPLDSWPFSLRPPLRAPPL